MKIDKSIHQDGNFAVAKMTSRLLIFVQPPGSLLSKLPILATTTHKSEERQFFGDLAPEISGVFDSKTPGSSNTRNNLRQFTLI